MKKITTFLCLFLWFATQIVAQTLDRKGALGVVISNTEDSTGIHVDRLVPGGTAEGLGLQANDLILTVNDKAYNKVQDLVTLTQTWRAGNPLTVGITRAGKAVKLKGKVIGKPMESCEHGEVIYGTMPFDGGLYRSILMLPKDVKNPPVMFFLPGFGCGSLDFWYDNQVPIKRFLDGLVAQGIAVYRIEKPGMGDSETTIKCNEMGYHYEVALHKAATEHLQKINTIDSDNIFFFGNSLGGRTAPLIAAEVPVKGVICWGTVARTWYEYELRILRDRQVQKGMDYASIDSNFQAKAPVVHAHLVQKMSPDEIMANPAYAEAFEEHYGYDGDKIFGMHYTYTQEINEANLGTAWKKANCPVLALHGEFDYHAIDSEWAEYTANMVNSFRPEQGTFKILAGTEHGYTKVSSMQKNIELLQAGKMDGAYRAAHFNEEIVEVVAEWIKGI